MGAIHVRRTRVSCRSPFSSFSSAPNSVDYVDQCDECTQKPTKNYSKASHAQIFRKRHQSPEWRGECRRCCSECPSYGRLRANIKLMMDPALWVIREHRRILNLRTDPKRKRNKGKSVRSSSPKSPRPRPFLFLYASLRPARVAALPLQGKTPSAASAQAQQRIHGSL